MRQNSNSLYEHLSQTGRALEAARVGFDEATDCDLLDYYLYETNALRAKHTYLMKQIKRQEEG